MIYVVYIILCLILIVLQSTALRFFLPACLTYDLLIPFVVYLGLFCPLAKALFLLIFCALLMDSVTGGPLGLYLVGYLWIFMGLRLMINVFQADSLVLMIVAVMVGVLLEQGIIWGAVALADNGSTFGMAAAGNVVYRMMTAGLTGPFLLLLFKKISVKITPPREKRL